LRAWIENDIAPENRKDYIKRHLIPEDTSLWETKNFKSFVKKRKELISDKLNSIIPPDSTS